MITTIIFIKGGVRHTVGYAMFESEAIKRLKKEYGNVKILFKQTL